MGRHQDAATKKTRQEVKILTGARILFLVVFLAAVVAVLVLRLLLELDGLLLGVGSLDGVAQPLFEPLTIARELAKNRV